MIRRGFTLIEMAITVAILALMTAFAAPLFRQWVGDATLTSATRSLVNGVNLAHAAALETGAPVTLCPYANTACGARWNAGWALWRTTSAGTLERIAAQQVLDAGTAVVVTAPAAASSVTFQPNGTATPLGSWVLCDARGAPHARAVTLFGSGLAFANTQPGVSLTGAPLTCP